MTIIPVIDLAAGRVVHARAGQRAEYQPLVASFADSSDPGAVITALVSLYRFDTVYVADLDAIEGRSDQRSVVRGLMAAFPQLDFWLDAGTDTLDITGSLANDHLRAVIGSENHDRDQLSTAVKARPDCLLSLDYRHDSLLGDPRLLENPELWPRDVIIMTLDQVGSDAGPDTGRIQSTRQLAPDHNYFAAGGVRDDHDLSVLADIPVTGALVATALHAGKIRGFRRNPDRSI